ncbi:MAG: RNA-binding transcriptional accessory protein [Steroidobacteraceae bacterium]|nr:RNA-binding transcriptional accessory protein [Deltaproteobacteria bacterium]
MQSSSDEVHPILPILIEQSGLAAASVANTVELLKEGATVPFIARYRKERTGELDEVQIRLLEDLLAYHSELGERKMTVLKSIAEQGKLTPELEGRIVDCRQKTELEDLYLPYRPKRRTKAIIARERGLEPLADLLAAGVASGSLEDLAAPFVNPEGDVPDAASALEGTGHILAERLADDADARAFVRRLTWEEGLLCSRVAADKKEAVTKFEMYYDHQEQLRNVPSHRLLAMRRGEKEEVLYLTIQAPVDTILVGLKSRIAKGKGVAVEFLERVAEDAYKRLIATAIEGELRLEARNRADEVAIKIFADNLRNLLLLPPAGSYRVLGVDPGLRTGSKLAAVDETGRLLEYATIYPHTGGGAKVALARETLIEMAKRCNSQLVAIGNGTAGRDMELFVKETLREAGMDLAVVIVNEAGASVYSASEIAREEFPDLDLTIRGGASIARRLQDPLAELVKIDPKSIGVGQYQHDVDQSALKKSLDAVVESCVNYVGVDLNTASWALLAYVSGIGETLARNIVRHRDQNGPFATRKSLQKVARFGPKTYEQAAGFLRIRRGVDPLDNTAVHPERYALVERMAADLGVKVAELVADAGKVERIELSRYMAEGLGLPTLKDIAEELKKPGRDPRAAFKTADLRDDIRELSDLKEGMILEGTVTNVAAFGAFVDIGVHQDGLVHVSHLSNRFLKEPGEAVKVGQVVKVKVLAVDIPRKRISLSIKEASPQLQQARPKGAPPQKNAPAAAPVNSWEKAGFRVREGRQK